MVIDGMHFNSNCSCENCKFIVKQQKSNMRKPTTEQRIEKLEKLVATIIKWIDFWETVKTPWKVKK